MSRTRLNIFLEPNHAKRLAEVAAAKGESKSTIVGGALASALLMDGEERRHLTHRLDRLARHIEKLEQDHNITIETLALFIRYFLSVTPAIPQEQNQAAWAQGRLRFTQFVQQLARNLQRGKSLVRDLQEELSPGVGEVGNRGDRDTEPLAGGEA